MNDRIDALERLHSLHAQGVLSDQEYAREKAAIIGQDHEQPPSTARQQREAQPVPTERPELAWSFSLKRALGWALAAMLVCLLIGGYFFVKAYHLAKERGELPQSASLISALTAPGTQQSTAGPSQPVWSSVYKKDQDGNYECELNSFSATTGVTVDLHENGPAALSVAQQGIAPDVEDEHASLAFDDGTVIQNVSVQAGKTFGVNATIPDGAAFIAAFGRSHQLSYRSPQGDVVKVPIERVDDFQRQLAACHQHPPVYSAQIAIPNPMTIPIIAQYEHLNETCRDSTDDNPAAAKACSDRDALYPKVSAEGYCYGTLDDASEADRNWHRCGPRSLR